MHSSSRTWGSRCVILVLLLFVIGGCAQYDNKRGVDVTWQPAALSDLERGETTRSEVLARLGPPSQVIALGDETVLYYLNEQADGNGLLLIVYNRFTVDTRYDRAIFFFDQNDRLTDHSAWIRADTD